MEDIIRLENQFYILTTSSRVDDRTCVLKEGDAFAVFDRYGDIQPLGRGDQGLYFGGTRFLSRLSVRVLGERPLLLGATLNENNLYSSSDMTNPDLQSGDSHMIARGSLHIFRTKFLWEGVCYERLRISNFSLQAIPVTVLYQIEADFADIFEVRGTHRAQRGKSLVARAEKSEVVLAYEGLDNVVRRTRITCTPDPVRLSPHQIEYSAHLAPKAEALFMTSIACETPSFIPVPLTYDNAFENAQAAVESERRQQTQVTTSSIQFNAWFNRSIADLRTMITATPFGYYPYAGIPWFSTVFGRDGILSAFQILWLNPDVAKGVLSYLAHTQATDLDPQGDAEPGKILHEAREGEMAALGEIPFGRYYGSVDATPLFVMLAEAYYERTADRPFLETLWPHIESALTWMDKYGDVDGDGFVEYQRHTPHGLLHQGWKDSQDSVFHADGNLAEGPIALCEVQAYVYRAKQGAATLAQVLGHPEKADRLRQEADRLQQAFERAFWCEELQTYALALDGRKKPCRVRTSNAGHCLFAGIATADHAKRTAETLLSEGSYSGWGIRTVHANELRYNPMSYHNGSIWPHENSLIAEGFWRYGLRREAIQVFTGLFDLSTQVELNRLPELFCGFRRRSREGPTLYPAACSPQSWAAGAGLLLLKMSLGLSLDAAHGKMYFTRPCLPPGLQEATIRGLKLGGASVNVTVRGQADNVDIEIDRQVGAVEAVVSK